MNSGSDTGTSWRDSLNWKRNWQTFVAEFRARRKLAKAERLTRDAEALRGMAREFMDQSDAVRLKARQCAREAARIAPWLTETT